MLRRGKVIQILHVTQRRHWDTFDVLVGKRKGISSYLIIHELGGYLMPYYWHLRELTPHLIHEPTLTFHPTLKCAASDTVKWKHIAFKSFIQNTTHSSISYFF